MSFAGVSFSDAKYYAYTVTDYGAVIYTCVVYWITVNHVVIGDGLCAMNI